MIKEEWSALPIASTPIQLHEKLCKLQHHIKEWSNNKIGNIKNQVSACGEFLGWLDKVKEERLPTDLEKFISCIIKQRYTQLSVLEEQIWKQRAKIKWELQGDKNTKYFHAIATNKKRRNTIAQIDFQGTQHSDHRTKAQVFFQFYKDLMGTESKQTPQIFWDNLYPTRQNLEELGTPILEKEIQDAINNWPNNKSPGPDDFTGEFYKNFLPQILPDLLKVFTTITAEHTSLAPLDRSYIILLPKQATLVTPSDFRPISLLHGVHKIFTKILQTDFNCGYRI